MMNLKRGSAVALFPVLLALLCGCESLPGASLGGVDGASFVDRAGAPESCEFGLVRAVILREGTSSEQAHRVFELTRRLVATDSNALFRRERGGRRDEGDARESLLREISRDAEILEFSRGGAVPSVDARIDGTGAYPFTVSTEEGPLSVSVVVMNHSTCDAGTSFLNVARLGPARAAFVELQGLALSR